MATQKVPNRLAKEKSPYMLQQAHNPAKGFFRSASMTVQGRSNYLTPNQGHLGLSEEIFEKRKQV